MSVCSASLYYMSIATIASGVTSTATAKGLSNSGTLSLAESNSSETTCLMHVVCYAVHTWLDNWGSSALIGLTSDSKCGQYSKKIQLPKERLKLHQCFGWLEVKQGFKCAGVRSHDTLCIIYDMAKHLSPCVTQEGFPYIDGQACLSDGSQHSQGVAPAQAPIMTVHY